MAETLGVIGLGYVGLPLAVQAAEKGYEVTGVDLDEGLVAAINERESPYVNDARFESALRGVEESRFRASVSHDDLRESENIVICAPTPTEGNAPDISYVTSAARQVGRLLRPGQLISLESTA